MIFKVPEAINPNFRHKHSIIFVNLWDYLTFGVYYEFNHKTFKKIFVTLSKDKKPNITFIIIFNFYYKN